MAASFSGDPKTVWIANPRNNDRKMGLIEEFWFLDRAGERWTAEAGYEIDGATIPRALWTLVGSPYTGQYRRASVVHDKACDEAVGNPARRRAADRMFYEACRAGGCSWFEAAVLYAGVRVGGLWAELTPQLAASAELEGARISHAPNEQAIVADYQYMADQITRLGETDDPATIEQRADAAEAKLREARFAGLMPG